MKSKGTATLHQYFAARATWLHVSTVRKQKPSLNSSKIPIKPVAWTRAPSDCECHVLATFPSAHNRLRGLLPAAWWHAKPARRGQGRCHMLWGAPSSPSNRSHPAGNRTKPCLGPGLRMPSFKRPNSRIQVGTRWTGTKNQTFCQVFPSLHTTRDQFPLLRVPLQLFGEGISCLLPWCRCTSVNLDWCVFICFKRVFYASSHTLKALSDRRVKHTSYEHQLQTALMLKLAHSAFALQCQLALWCFPKGPFLFFPPCIVGLWLTQDQVPYTLFIAYIWCSWFFFPPYSSNYALKPLISSLVFSIVLTSILPDSTPSSDSFWVCYVKLPEFDFSKHLVSNTFLWIQSEPQEQSPEQTTHQISPTGYRNERPD